MKKQEKTKEVVLDPREKLFNLLDEVPPKLATRIVKNYTSYFEAERQISEVIKALKFFENEERVPLETIKYLVDQLDLVIATLGNITLALNPNIDETAIIVEINEMLGLKEPGQIDFISQLIHTIIATTRRSFEDRHFYKCLDYLKEKSWILLEAMDKYAVKYYKHSIF
jgi:hypothetical protein